MAVREPERKLAAALAQVELVAAGPRAGLAAVAESAPATTNEEPPWQERARDRRDERAQRRQERQDNARSRRVAEEGRRAESVAMVRTRGEPAAAVSAEPPTAAVQEEAPGTNGTRATARRMQRGTVKWFSEAKGYGFIRADDGTDAFVHHSAITSEGFRTLSEGQMVSYEEVEGPKGLLALNVVRQT
jgi:CspA family cold shock protein